MKKTGIFAPKTQFFPFKTQCTAGLRPELACRKVYKKKPELVDLEDLFFKQTGQGRRFARILAMDSFHEFYFHRHLAKIYLAFICLPEIGGIFNFYHIIQQGRNDCQQFFPNSLIYLKYFQDIRKTTLTKLLRMATFACNICMQSLQRPFRENLVILRSLVVVFRSCNGSLILLGVQL